MYCFYYIIFRYFTFLPYIFISYSQNYFLFLPINYHYNSSLRILFLIHDIGGVLAACTVSGRQRASVPAITAPGLLIFGAFLKVITR